MDEDRRKVYLGFGWAFVGLGAVVAGLSLLQTLFDLEIFNGNPLGVALLIGGIGALLLWTIRNESKQD